MRRRNRKDLKRRVVQAAEENSPRRHWSEAISPERGWFRLGEISLESTSNLLPSTMFSPERKVTYPEPERMRLKEDFRVLEGGPGFGGTREPSRTRTTKDSCSSLQSFFFEV